MAADMDSEMKVSNVNANVNIDYYRKLVQNYLKLVSECKFLSEHLNSAFGQFKRYISETNYL